MNREVPFSSKRMLLTLTLCACAVILLQNHELSQRLSFPLTLGAMAASASSFLFRPCCSNRGITPTRSRCCAAAPSRSGR